MCIVSWDVYSYTPGWQECWIPFLVCHTPSCLSRGCHPRNCCKSAQVSSLPWGLGAFIFGVINADQEVSTFYPALGGRNVSAGLACWVLSLYGHRKPLALFLLCWTCTGIFDTRLCLTLPCEKRTWLHAFNTCWVPTFNLFALLHENNKSSKGEKLQ